MRLARIGPISKERPHVAVGVDAYVDVSDILNDYDESFFAAGRLSAVRSVVESRRRAGMVEPLGERRLGAPIARPHQVLCIGLNYRDHAAEAGMPVPDEPVVFNKAPNTVVGPYDDVVLPPGSTKTDWEVELGVVIGRRTSYARDDRDAVGAIFGYVVSNDISERSFQFERGGQWVKGKSAETFNPCGPFLVTTDEVPDVLALSMWLTVNGASKQRAQTSSMVFRPAELVRYLSQFLVLEPGDLVNTGTPAGVGMGADPPVYLGAGDIIELGIDGLGSQRQRVRQHEAISAGAG